MDNTIDIIQRILIATIGILSTFEALILFLRSKKNKARKTLGFMILLWGIAYLTRLIGFYQPEDTFSQSYSLFRANVLIVGNIYITLMYLFPMQVIIPGWLNAKRIILLFAPIGLIACIYYIGMSILNQNPEILVSYAQIGESFLHFNVWYRLIFILSNVVYLVVIIRWLVGHEKKYIQWKNDNYANQDNMDISWMNAYICIIGLISFAYLLVLAYGTQIPVIIHSLIVAVSFSYIFYKGLFYESPYPEDFFSDEPKKKKDEDDTIPLVIEAAEAQTPLNEMTFESRIPSYISTLKKWLDEEKPYLYKDFKLTDVARVLPLNRSYLSRVFNEGFGRNFSEVIGAYRVHYSKTIIEKKPDLPLYKVAQLSGFNSDSTFIRVFKQETGITPSQYRGGGIS